MKLFEDQTDVDTQLIDLVDRLGRLLANSMHDEGYEPNKSIRIVGSEIAAAVREGFGLLAAVQARGYAELASALQERQ